MPDAITLLTQDHRSVDQLFEKYGSSPSPDIAKQICQELTIHAAIEESVLYPALADMDDGVSLNSEAVDEHAEMKKLIVKIQSLDYATDKVESIVKELQGDVQHHVKDEETEMFPKMKEALGAQVMNELGDKLAMVKETEVSVLAGLAPSDS